MTTRKPLKEDPAKLAALSSKRIFISGNRNASTWAMRAWLALKEGGITFDDYEVDLRRPQRFQGLELLRSVSPSLSVPVLLDGGVGIFDSLAIMAHANDLSGGKLMPDDPRLRSRAHSMLAWQHAGLSGCCGALSFESAFHPQRRALTDREQQEASQLFATIHQEIWRYGGPFLYGDITLADLALVPTFVRILAYKPVIEGCDEALAWVDLLLNRPSVKEWMAEANRLAPVYPDADGPKED
ncbi:MULTISPECIES: glutathione S-transferase family protein [Kordiimonas]|jgi:glutathione S-transferase|uniref:glutathione S-transferase family protein n=1 Tax=Kordiimonas TaxID=288021 RepID=UPI0025809C0B|nr:glutathione S-transferase family protein [Kordiimonas sp. UBA4487]